MRLFVPLSRNEFDALTEIARAERRRPPDQAAAMLAAALADPDRLGFGRRPMSEHGDSTAPAPPRAVAHAVGAEAGGAR